MDFGQTKVRRSVKISFWCIIRLTNFLSIYKRKTGADFTKGLKLSPFLAKSGT